ncbi:MAG: hypothetical protein HYY18_04605 [Planctomycetes bacterium]|nr:hypothetical protein [Planctomycetota bacterium]
MFATRLFPLVLAALALAMPLRADEGEAKETPKEAFEAFKKAAKAKDGDAVWGFFSKGTRAKMVEQMSSLLETIKQDADGMAKLAEKTGKTVEELNKMSDEEFVKTMMVAEMVNDKDDIDKVEWISSEVKGEQAICVTKDKNDGDDAKAEKVVMVLEDGRWKLDLEATQKLKEGEEEDGGDDEEPEEEEGSDK